jgi:uncharacterized protein (TIGR02271 family)
MPLYRIQDFNPNYREEAFDNRDFKGIDVYSPSTNEKIGSIDDVLVDETGHFRYFVVDTDFKISGKKITLPVARCRMDRESDRFYVEGLDHKEQVEQMPDYNGIGGVDYYYEEQIRSIFRTPNVETSEPVEESLPVEMAVSVEDSLPVEVLEVEAILRRRSVRPPVATPSQPSSPQPTTPERETYSFDYKRDPDLYQLNERDHQKFKLYEERLIASKSRHKAGEVSIGKRVETSTAHASVPVEKERVVIERNTPEGKVVNPNEVDFDRDKNEVARMEVYEETADIDKQTVVKEEVEVKKEVVRDTVEASEEVRREELEVDTQGRLNNEKR